MSIDRDDVKHGIDTVAEKLKEITDMIAAKLNEAGGEASKKSREVALKTGDMMIEHGQRLKAAAKEPATSVREN